MTDSKLIENSKILIKRHQVLVVYKGQELTKELEEQIDMHVERLFTPNGCLSIIVEKE